MPSTHGHLGFGAYEPDQLLPSGVPLSARPTLGALLSGCTNDSEYADFNWVNHRGAPDICHSSRFTLAALLLPLCRRGPGRIAAGACRPVPVVAWCERAGVYVCVGGLLAGYWGSCGLTGKYHPSVTAVRLPLPARWFRLSGSCPDHRVLPASLLSWSCRARFPAVAHPVVWLSSPLKTPQT